MVDRQVVHGEVPHELPEIWEVVLFLRLKVDGRALERIHVATAMEIEHTGLVNPAPRYIIYTMLNELFNHG